MPSVCSVVSCNPDPDDPAVGIPATLDGRAPPSLGLQYKRAAAFCGDLIWHAPRRLAAKVAYVFSNIGAEAPQEHKEVSSLMSRYRASFIADLDPDSGNAGPNWPAYSLAEPQLMAFDVNTTALATPIADTYRAEQIQYINDNLGPLGRRKKI